MVSDRATLEKTQSTTIYDDKDISHAFGKFFEKTEENFFLHENPSSQKSKNNGDSKKYLMNCNIL
jgi:hypothetical protein